MLSESRREYYQLSSDKKIFRMSSRDPLQHYLLPLRKGNNNSSSSSVGAMQTSSTSAASVGGSNSEDWMQSPVALSQADFPMLSSSGASSQRPQAQFAATDACEWEEVPREKVTEHFLRHLSRWHAVVLPSGMYVCMYM